MRTSNTTNWAAWGQPSTPNLTLQVMFMVFAPAQNLRKSHMGKGYSAGQGLIELQFCQLSQGWNMALQEMCQAKQCIFRECPPTPQLFSVMVHRLPHLHLTAQQEQTTTTVLHPVTVWSRAVTGICCCSPQVHMPVFPSPEHRKTKTKSWCHPDFILTKSTGSNLPSVTVPIAAEQA